MEATTPSQLYAADLDQLEAELAARDAQEAADNDVLAAKQRKAAAGRKGKGKAAAVSGLVVGAVWCGSNRVSGASSGCAGHLR